MSLCVFNLANSWPYEWPWRRTKKRRRKRKNRKSRKQGRWGREQRLQQGQETCTEGYKISLFQTVWYWEKEKYTIELKKESETEPSLNRHLIHDPKNGTTEQYGMDNVFNKWCWASWLSIRKKKKIDPYFTPYRKINSRYN